MEVKGLIVAGRFADRKRMQEQTGGQTDNQTDRQPDKQTDGNRR